MQLPFLELPLCIGYADGFPDKIVTGKFTPSFINSYHHGYMTDEPEPFVTTFIYHGTQVFQCAISVEELEAKLKTYWAVVEKQQVAMRKTEQILGRR